MLNYNKIFLLLLTFISFITTSMEQYQKKSIKNAPSLKFQIAYKLLQPLETCQSSLECQALETNISKLKSLLPDEGLQEYITNLQSIITSKRDKRYITIKQDPNLSLLLAIELGHTDLFEDFIKLGANINGEYVYQWNQVTPLIVAARNRKEVTIETLVALGAEVNYKTKREGNTALFTAVEFQSLPSAQALINAGADINSKNIKGYTPLHFAHRSSRDIIELLIDKGAAINARADNGSTPLMEAVIAKNIQIVKSLLDKGARVDLRNNEGKTALDLARDNNLPSIVYLLQQYRNNTH